ncbi:MAG TPA: group III truncated hemoglobin [Caulobacteraceae bacterium]
MTEQLVRRPRVGPGEGIVTEAMISDVVETFYGRVREDEVLGPIFNARVEDWPEHLAKLKDFWSSVLLMTGRFKGRPMPVHAAIPDIGRAEFDHWLALFARTVDEVCPPRAAALFRQKSRMIAESLQLGIAASRGEIPPLGRSEG